MNVWVFGSWCTVALCAFVVVLGFDVEVAEAQCPQGTVAIGNTCCPPGHGLDPQTGQCVAPQGNGCPTGTTLQNGVCVQSTAPVAAQPAPSGIAQPVDYVTHPTWGLVIAGLATFGVVYVVGLAVTAAIDEEGDSIGTMAIPLAGPWVTLANDAGGYAGALVPAGILQAGGLIMTILGLAIRSRSPVPRADGLQVTPWVATNGPDAAAGGLNLRLPLN